MKDYAVTDKNAISLYFQSLQGTGGMRVIDLGCFLKRIGALSRTVLDLSIPEEELNEAKKLDSDIDKEIKELKEMLEKLNQMFAGSGSGDSTNGSGSGNSGAQPSGGSAREDEVRDFLEEQQTRTKEEQELTQSEYDERNYWLGEDAGSGDDDGNLKPW